MRLAPDACRGLAEALFVTEGFAGNTSEYSDPRNSLLDDVIDRRLGIPISLSVLMIEVGRRIGLALHGVGMPGHFLVGVDEDPEVFVDPFHAGRVLDVDGCRAIFAALQGPDAPFSPAYLAPTGPRAILLRVLNNLQRSYLERSAVDAVWVRASGSASRSSPHRSDARSRRCSARSDGSPRPRSRSSRLPIGWRGRTRPRSLPRRRRCAPRERSG